MARRRLLVFASLLVSVLAACGRLLGGDEETSPPPRPGGDSGDSGDDGTVFGPDGGQPEGGATCSANGTLEIDPTFAPPTIPLDQPRSALSSSGIIGTVGRCRDAGQGLELARTSLDGSVTPATTCFGSSGVELVESIAPTTQGWVVGGARNTGFYNARAVHVSDTGIELGEDDLQNITNYPNSYSKFALEIAGSIVYGGYRSSGANLPERGFLKVMGELGVKELGDYTLPVAAAVSADRLYVAITLGAEDVSTKQLLVKRYEVVGSDLGEDATFVTGTSPVVMATSLGFDGLGSILVEGDVVSIAVGDGATTKLLRLANGTWTQQSIAAYAPVRLARSCDGALIVGGPFDLGATSVEQALVRRIDGGPGGQLKLPDTQANVVSLLRHPSGDLYVFQNAAGTSIARRVLP